MLWIEQYRSKLKTADEALGAVKSGDRVYIHQGCSEPEELVRAMVRRAPELRDVEVLHMCTFGLADFADPKYAQSFRHSSFYVAKNVRQSVQDGHADYIPVFLHEIEGLFTSGTLPLDVALIQCTPPDDYGFMSLNVGVDITLTAAQHARIVIAQVNDQAPRTLGDTFIHVTKVNAIVEASHPLPEYRPPAISPTHRQIARHVANLVPDGATIQVGIGGVPAAVLESLTGHHDLGVHSEMISDGVIDLIRTGVINNAKKTLHPNKVVAGFVLGTKKIFDFLHNNPIFEFHPTRHVNDPFVIAQNDRMVAINSAIEVDLTGQVCADSIGYTPYSGIGGQVDFIRGAAHSKGGLPIITLPATAKEGTVSRIVAGLKPGAGVVTSRGDVHYVVTEHGVAYLHGKTLRQRVEAMIQIAAPQFRDELTETARAVGLLDNKAPVGV